MNTYKGRRFPLRIYFPRALALLSLQYQARGSSRQDIEDRLADRGISVGGEAIRLWYPKHSLRLWDRLCIKFGALDARRFKRKRKKRR